MTYSWSSTVHGAIVGSRKRIARVVCSEARPGLEGLRLSRSLARRQVPVSLYTDAALMDLPESVDLVVVGADAFVPGGVVNKIGTSALARLARTAGRPFFVLAETSKVLPRALARFYRLPAGPGREIASRAPGLRVENPYFDYTPYRFVTGVLTERGQASIGQLNREMNSLRVSEALLEALGQRDDGVSRSQAGAGAYPFPGFVLR
jgi:translation initiation factor 2B subunit (eIF-2B alpha/beta/delta family)